MRRVIFSCAMSLDGYIAGPNGEYDWIVMDPEFDFAAMNTRFDTFLFGRKTYEAMRQMGSDVRPAPGTRNIVFSRTLKPEEHPHVDITCRARQAVEDLRAKPGKEILLFGGGDLFRSLLGEGLIDGVEAAVIPVLLGGGTPILQSPAARTALRLTKHRAYGKTGVVSLHYDVERPGSSMTF